jgi:hypothetical protein
VSRSRFEPSVAPWDKLLYSLFSSLNPSFHWRFISGEFQFVACIFAHNNLRTAKRLFLRFDIVEWRPFPFCVKIGQHWVTLHVNTYRRFCQHPQRYSSVPRWIRFDQKSRRRVKHTFFVQIFSLWLYNPIQALGRLHETFRFTSVTRSRTVGRTPWTDDQLVARPLPVHKHRKTHTQHKH